MNKNLHIYLLPIILLIVKISYSQEYFGTTIIGNTTMEMSYHSAKDSNNAIYSVGYFSSPLTVAGTTISYAGGTVDGLLCKYDSEGIPIWAKGFGSGYSDVAKDVAVDSEGNIYLTGYFQGAGSQAFDADPGEGVYHLEQPAAILSRDCFIIKLDANGDFLWAKQVSNPSGGAANEDSHAIEVDDDGNVYVAGAFLYADFDPSPTESVEIFASNGMAGTDGFVLKLDTDGNFIWVKVLECMDNAVIYDLDIDENTNLYITGSFEDSIDLDPSSSVAVSFSSNGGKDIFMAKLNVDGEYIWGNSFGGAQIDFPNVITSIGTDVYIGGMFAEEVDLDPSAAFNTVISTGFTDAFLSKFDSDGNYNYSYTLGGDGPSFEEVYNIKEFVGGDILMSGSFVNTADFDNGAEEETSTSNGNSDNFLLHINADGAYQTHIAVGGSNTEKLAQFELNASYDILFLGTFRSPTVDFDPFDGTDTKSNIGLYDIYMSRFSLVDTSGISDINADNVQVFPNPVKDVLYIENGENISSYLLTSITGQIISKGFVVNNTIDLSAVSKGFYLLNLQSKTASLLKKIVKLD